MEQKVEKMEEVEKKVEVVEEEMMVALKADVKVEMKEEMVVTL